MVREDSDGALSHGGGILYATEAQARGSDCLLSVGFDSRGEPTPLCSQRGGTILAEAGWGVAGTHEGHGLMGEGESGDREGVKGDWPITV